MYRVLSWCLLSLFSLLILPVGAQAPATTPKVVRTEYDMKKLVVPPPLSETELAGRRLFVQRCSVCHDPPGAWGPWLDQGTVTAAGEPRVRDVIMTGSRRMPGWQYTFEPAQVDQIIAFLKTVTPDKKPAPSR